MNRKGFTLVEVLASVVIVTIILVIVVNVVSGTMASTINEIDEVSEKQVFNAVNNYIIEENISFNSDGYACISVQELVDYGYLKTSDSNDKIIKVNRNNDTKVIDSMMYVDVCK